MNDIWEKEDKLRQVDFDAIFPETPAAIHDAVARAGFDIRRHRLAAARRRKMLTVAAAVLVVAVGAVAAMSHLHPKRQDNVVATPVEMDYENATLTEVYTSKDDRYYHRDPDCAQISSSPVALPLITAREFDKEPCPVCGGRQ